MHNPLHTYRMRLYESLANPTTLSFKIHTSGKSRHPFPLTILNLLLASVLFATEVKCYELTQMSPRVVFTKQGPVQGFIGPRVNNPHHLPQLTGSNFNIRQYGGRPVVEVCLYLSNVNI
jgi:hypothetical protein